MSEKLDKAKGVELNKSLLDKLLPLKLKIMPDIDGDVQYVSCSIRVSICPHKRISSYEYFYKANDMTRCSSTTLTGAINEAMNELVEALKELDK